MNPNYTNASFSQKRPRASSSDWIEGARLRTLPAALAPVLLGTMIAFSLNAADLWNALLALGVALALQVGVNYANDYSDGIRGTDAQRVGPQRLTGSGLARPGTVLSAALVSFALAAVLGLVLLWRSGDWWLLFAGGAAIIAAWFYTGGKKPYGYQGLGEVMVLIFFGYLATLGTLWTQAHQCPPWAWVLATALGVLSAALLMINNIRDIATDEVSGKRTLAVRLGEAQARRVYVWMLRGATLLGPLTVGGLMYLGGRLVGDALLLSILPALTVESWVAKGIVDGQVQGLELVKTLRRNGLLVLYFALCVGVACIRIGMG